jgi:hypothetical protein
VVVTKHFRSNALKNPFDSFAVDSLTTRIRFCVQLLNAFDFDLKASKERLDASGSRHALRLLYDA